MPTTSPARTCSAMRSRAVPKGSSLASERPATSSTEAPGWRSCASSVGGSAPIIMRESEALLSWRGSHMPVTLPPRMTVQAVHSSRISCSLWLM